MIPIAGANCIYFEPSDSGGVCNHPDMRRGFWGFSHKENCVLTHEGFEAECILRMPKFTPPAPKKTKISTPTKIPTPAKKSSGTHIHKPKKHIHKKK